MTLKCGVKLTTPKGTPLMALCIDLDLKAKVTLFNPNFSFFRPSFLVFFSSISFIFFLQVTLFQAKFHLYGQFIPNVTFQPKFYFFRKAPILRCQTKFLFAKFYFKAKVLLIMPKFHLFFSQTQIFSLSPSLPFQPEPNLILMTAYISLS